MAIPMGLSARAALDHAISDMRGARTVGEAAGLLREAGERVGLERAAVIAEAARPTILRDETGRSVAEQLGWPGEFVDRWLTRNLSARSPVMLRARLEHLPFKWSIDQTKRSTEMPARAKEALRALQSLGITGGVVVPVRMPRGRFGCVSWLGGVGDAELGRLIIEDSARLLAVAHFFFDVLLRAFEGPAAAEDGAMLSPREVECLTFAANGFSDLEVSRTMGLSPHTVRFHHRKAAEKLGARSRTSAVALAMQLGLIGRVS